MIDDATLLWRPVALFLHGDREIASATTEAFTPVMSLDPASLAYAGLGLIAR